MLVSQYALFITVIAVGTVFKIKKDNDLSYFLLAILSGASMPMGEVLAVFYFILLHVFTEKGFKVQLAPFKLVMFTFGWLLCMTYIGLDTSRLDNLASEYLIRNVYKWFVLPLGISLYFLLNKSDIELFFQGTIRAYLLFGVSAFISLMIGANHVILFHSQLIIPLMLLVFKIRDLRNALILMICMIAYSIMIVRFGFVVNSQEVLLFVLLIIIWSLSNRLVTLIPSLFFTLITVYFIHNNFEVVYAFIKDLFPNITWISFKLTQFLYLFNISDPDTLPWSIRVRFWELAQVITGNPISLILGDGLASYIKNLDEVVLLTGEAFGPKDFSQAEISLGRYYGLHNTSRGLLHYGLIYFILIAYLYFKRRKTVDKLSLSFVLAGAFLNPSLIAIALLSTSKSNDQ